MKEMNGREVVESSLFLFDLSGRIFEWAQAIRHNEDATMRLLWVLAQQWHELADVMIAMRLAVHGAQAFEEGITEVADQRATVEVT